MMKKKPRHEKTVRDIRRATRRHYSAEEKISIVLEGLRGEGNIAELCRREGINANVYYRWSKEYEYYLYNRSLENKEKWGVRLPILVRAMVAAKDRLYAFGPQELYNQKKMIGILDQAASQKLVKEQEDAFNGKSGATFLVINRENGTIENGYNLHTNHAIDRGMLP